MLSGDSNGGSYFTNITWNKAIPLKVTIFAYQLLGNMISTKNNLFIRGIINVNDQLCVSGCDNIENVDHLFMGCEFFENI